VAKKKANKEDLEKKIEFLKEENRELKLDRSLLNSLLKYIPENIYFKDKESRFVKIGKAFADYMGFDDPNKIIGKTDFDLFGEEHARPAYEDEQKIMKTGNLYRRKKKKFILMEVLNG